MVPRSIPTILPIELQEFLLNVYNKIPNIRATIQQFVQLGHDFLAVGSIVLNLQRFVPLASAITQLSINVVQFFLKTLFRGLQPVFQGSEVSARRFRFTQFIQRFVQLKNFFNKLAGACCCWRLPCACLRWRANIDVQRSGCGVYERHRSTLNCASKRFRALPAWHSQNCRDGIFQLIGQEFWSRAPISSQSLRGNSNMASNRSVEEASASCQLEQKCVPIVALVTAPADLIGAFVIGKGRLIQSVPP